MSWIWTGRRSRPCLPRSTSLFQSDLWFAGHWREHQRARFVGAAGESRSGGAGDAGCRGGKKMGRRSTTCTTDNSMVMHKETGRNTGYGALAEEAAKLPVPANPKRKSAKDYKYIGKPTKRIDSKEKVNGKAVFGIDVRRPQMLHAVVARCPVFGGKVKSFDGTKAKAVPRVKSIVEISTGVAVVADNTWSAMQGREALQVTWDEGETAKTS